MTYEVILENAIQTKIKYPSLRLGQCVYNEFSQFVDCSEAPDCFYNDENIRDFLNFVKSRLEDQS